MLSSIPKTASGWLACIAVSVGSVGTLLCGAAVYERPALKSMSIQTAVTGEGIVRHAVLKGVPSQRFAVAQLMDGANVIYECRIRSIDCMSALPKAAVGKQARIYLVNGKIVKTVIDGLTTDTHANLLARNSSAIGSGGVYIAIASALGVMASGLRRNNGSER